MRYLVQERIFSITTDFWIEDEAGNRVFFVDGRALSLRETFELKDAAGNLLILIRKKLFAMRDTMEIEDGRGLAAKVRPAFFSPLRHRYEIELADGERLEATGNFTDKNWELTNGTGQVIGRISRQWFRVRDTYGVEVAPGADDPLVIAIAVCIDRIHEDEVRRNRLSLVLEHRDGQRGEGEGPGYLGPGDQVGAAWLYLKDRRVGGGVVQQEQVLGAVARPAGRFHEIGCPVDDRADSCGGRRPEQRDRETGLVKPRSDVNETAGSALVGHDRRAPRQIS